MNSPTEAQPPEAKTCECGHTHVLHQLSCLYYRCGCTHFRLAKSPAPAASTKEEIQEKTREEMKRDPLVEKAMQIFSEMGAATSKPAGETYKLPNAEYVDVTGLSMDADREPSDEDTRFDISWQPLQPPSAAPSAEVASDTPETSLCNRLRGIYSVPVNDGAGLLDGKDTFTRTFDVPQIQQEAADTIEELEQKLIAAREAITAQQQRGNEYKGIAQRAEANLFNALSRIERLTEELAKANTKLVMSSDWEAKYRDAMASLATRTEQRDEERAKCAELEKPSHFNDTDHSDADLIAAISDMVLEFKPDAASCSAGTLDERVQAAVAIVKQQAAQIAGLREAATEYIRVINHYQQFDYSLKDRIQEWLGWKFEAQQALEKALADGARGNGG